MLLFEEAGSILQGLQNILVSLFVAIDWDIIFFAGLGFMLLFAVFFIIKSRFSYEVRVVKKLLKLNNWLNKHKYIDQNNLIEFNNMMKHTPKHLRYYWHEYMLNREKSPSHYMSTYNLVEKPLKSSSYLSNIKSFKTTTIITAGLVALFALLKLSTTTPTLGHFALCALTPVLMLVLYGIISIIMRATQNANINSLYQYVHYFGRFLDRAVSTMPDYVDFEVLFTRREIKKGIPVLNEYLEKRARQEQEELEKARINAVEHETYDFSSTGINGSLVLERAINESETFINIRSRLLSEIQQLEDEIESLKRTYENSEKDYQKKMQVSKENVDRLRKQQEETTNRIENNYIKKQQADEIKKQEQLEKDHDSATIRFNQETEALTAEIKTRREELEKRRQYVEDAMKAEYQTFSSKLYKSLETIIKEENQDEREELLEIKDEIAEELKNATAEIAQRDHEIAELYAILEANGIDRNAYAGFASETLNKESKRNRRHTKVPVVEEVPALTPAQNLPYDPNLIPLDQIAEKDKQYGEDGGFYDPNGYYRYPNGTYFTPNAEFHDEYGGWYEADGVTYHPAEEASQATEVAQDQPQGYVDYPAETQEFEDQPQDDFEEIPQEDIRRMEDVPEDQRQYTEDGGFFDADGYYFYPNGTYFTPDGRFFDENGGWFEADGVTYHKPENYDEDNGEDEGQLLEEIPQEPEYEEDRKEKITLKKRTDADVDTEEAQKEQISQDALKEIQKLRDQFNIEVDKEKAQKADAQSKPEEEQVPAQEPVEEQPKTEEIQQPVEEEAKPENLFEIPAENKVEEVAETSPETQINDNLFAVAEVEEQADKKAVEPQEKPVEEPKTSAPQQQKRGRGRPAKTEKPIAIMGVSQDDSPSQTSDLFEGFVAVEEPLPAETEKRGRGRPKKEVVEIEEPQTEKRGRGRPKKIVDQPDENQAEKRGRGRPKKETTVEPVQETTEKRGRGRPKKEVAVEEVQEQTEKRGRGRPKKSVASVVKPAVAGEFDSLMAPKNNPELDELEKLNAKIESENKRLAEHQEELNNQLTETLFHLSNDED